MKIKPGTYLGMGITEVNLLVHVKSVNTDTFVGHVINGNWDFVYNAHEKKLMFDPPMGKREVRESHILFTDPIPKVVGYTTYNEVIAYMNDHLRRPMLVSWLLRTKYNVVYEVTTLYKRLKTSTQMFVRTWKQGSTDIHHIDIDDDFPF